MQDEGQDEGIRWDLYPHVAAIPQARLEVIAGAGHACHLEQPEAVAHLLASW